MIALAFVSWYYSPPSVPNDMTGYADVRDGDTLVINDTKIRLFGIDAPEYNQTCLDQNEREWTCGRWVTRELRDQLRNQTVRCETLDTDRYGRAVARCFVNDQDLAEALVLQGRALAFRRYSRDYIYAEDQARAKRAGLHDSTFMRPEEWRDTQVAQ